MPEIKTGPADDGSYHFSIDGKVDQERYHNAASAAAAARHRLLPEDGVIDYVAIGIAVNGERVVNLSPHERQIAARAIVARGGSADTLVKHLGCSKTTAVELLRKHSRKK